MVLLVVVVVNRSKDVSLISHSVHGWKSFRLVGGGVVD